MKTLEDIEKKPENGSKGAFWIAALVAALVLAGVVGLLLLRPTTEEYQKSTIEGAMREDSPEFEALTKKLIIENDDRTTESPTALGTIQMSIWGKIRNLSNKTVTGLELKIMVVDLSEHTIKEKTEIVIPKKQASLEPSQVMAVNVIMDGFKKEDNRANIHWKVTAIKVQ